ncbi:MAG: LLM class flavin-dependent oxidoreductase [Actinomycetia bacterium]|nr:LLM class flavin-dependent oxidoreductase [Actinomycetes bacterium]
MSKPSIRFGICTDNAFPFTTMADYWQRVEQLGFDSVWNCDHFNRPSDPEGPYYEAWTLLAALATHTERIRIGVLVSSNTFRHPALLAQSAVTVDHVSSGRLELGFGGGWYEPEHERFGIEFPGPGNLRRRYREAVQIVDSLLRGETTTFAGRFYELDSAYLRPAPVQKPRPPLMLAAHKPLMLRVCAEYADAWNSYGTVDEMRLRNETLDEHCADLGRDPTEIWRSFYGWSARMTDQGLPDPWSSCSAFEEVVGRYRAVGINEFIIDLPRPEQFGVMEQVARDVLPRLRAEASRTDGS